MRKSKHYLLLLFTVFFIALLFRFYKLEEYPISLTMDEVSIGYNAYSLLKTGRDEWGQTLPLAFKSVGDYKPSVDVYLTVPFIALFGLNEFAVRAPVALMGALTCLVFALLLIELGFKKEIGFLVGIWLAILPWHVHYSRASFEAVTALFFALLGTYAFFRAKSLKSYIYVIIAAVSFSLSVWAYHAERLFVPLFVLGLLFVWRKSFKFFVSDKKKLFFVAITLLIFTIPFIYLTVFTDAVRTRALSTSVFREESLIKVLHNGKYDSIKQFIFENDYYLVFRHIAGKYLNYFDLRFWFWKGMSFTPPGFYDSGLFYIADLLLILAGIYLAWTSKNKNVKNLFLLWFFIGPLPASLTMNEQHPLRALVWIPAFGIAMASTYSYVFSKKFKLHYTRYLYIGLIVINILYFKDLYFRQFPRFFSEYWQYGYKQIALYACQNRDKYENIVITDTFGTEGPVNTGTPYLYYLFYCRYNPLVYQTGNHGDFDNLKFRRVDWKNDRKLKNSMFIATPWDINLELNSNEKIIKSINYPNGTEAFVFVETL